MAAGMTLAHAVWNVSDLPSGESLVPLGFVEEGDGLALVRFDGDTQKEAILAGKRQAKEWEKQGRTWALAREGLIRVEGGPVDVLTVDLWGPSMEARVSLLQRYRPFTDPAGFELLGSIQVVVDGKIIEGADAQSIAAGVLRGVTQHSHACEAWKRWQ